MLLKKRVSYSDLVRMTVVPVVLGLAAGVAGALTAESYLAASSPVEPPLIQIGRPTVSVTSPMPETSIAESLHRVDVPLYVRKAASGTDLADRGRAPSEAIGYAVVITSDGWLATSQSLLGSGQLQAAVNGRLLTPTAQVSDPRTGVVFLKIDATALPVSGFEDTDQLRAGSPLYALEGSGAFAAASFAGAGASDPKSTALLRDADRFSRAFRLDRTLDARSVGGAVLTSGGSLAGIVAADAEGVDRFVPMHLIRPVLSAVFRNQPIARAALGARYLVLDEAVFPEGATASLSGTRISGSRATGLPAVRSGSAAARAGLLDGDLVLNVDGVELSGGRDLAELVAEYAPGSKAKFEIQRQGERRTVEVTFD